MQANYVQRLRFSFSKFGPTRYIGHLDLARTLERSLRRAAMPVAYSQGFNPRPRMQLAAALPLGYSSDYELADIWLMTAVPPTTALKQIMSRIAPGLAIQRVWEVPLSEASLQSFTHSARYQAVLPPETDPATTAARLHEIMAADKLIRARRDKEYDLRPLILSANLETGDDGRPLLNMELLLQPSLSGRPDELLEELGVDPLDAHIRRTYIQLMAEATQ
jgi:radical SAM-linked protein